MMVALTPSEYRFLDYVTEDKAKKQIEKCLTELRGLGTKKLLFEQTLKKVNNANIRKKIIDIGKSIKRVNKKISKLDRTPEETYALLKRDFRIANITIKDYTMIITTKEVIIEQKDSGYLNYGRFKIYLNLEENSYDIKSLDNKKHPMIPNGHIHICSHESRLRRELDRGSFYNAAIIMLSFLFQEDLDFKVISPWQ